MVVADASTLVLRPPGADQERPLRSRTGTLRSDPARGEVGRQSGARGHTQCHGIGGRGRDAVGSRGGARGAARRGPYRPGGSPQAVLVHGEAGIGKTTLVRSVVEELRAEGAQVLWGQGLRFGAVEAMYHPLVLALEGWLAEADEGRRTALVQAVPSASLILPSLGAPPAHGKSGLVTVVDALLGRAFAGGPSVLVVDDVHWADSATRDALSYLVAGFARSTAGAGHHAPGRQRASDEFHRWLANLRRLPGTQEQVVVRLDLAATADQVSLLLGEPRRRGSWSRSTTGHAATPTSASC